MFIGLVVRSYHFDVTACAEARRLENNAHIYFSFLDHVPDIFKEKELKKGRQMYATK